MFQRVVHRARSFCARRENIQRSRKRNFAVRRIRRGGANFRRRRALRLRTPVAASNFSRFTKTNRAAFQILLAKCAVTEDAVFAEHDVGARRGHAGQREAHRVGAEFVD